MAYSSNSDLLNEFGTAELARLTGDSAGETINYDRINSARSAADAVIDVFLMGRYQIPLPEPVPDIINKISNDFTIANLFEISYARTSVPETIIARKLEAMKIIKSLQAGTILLEVAEKDSKIISNKDVQDTEFTEQIMDLFFDSYD